MLGVAFHSGLTPLPHGTPTASAQRHRPESTELMCEWVTALPNAFTSWKLKAEHVALCLHHAMYVERQLKIQCL